MWQVAFTVSVKVTCSCILISKWYDTLDGGDVELLIFVVLAIAMVVVAMQATQPMLLLGAVSPSCDDLTEDLNKLCIKNLEPETHKRVLMLETALKNVNHGSTGKALASVSSG
jgi:hypothetical protein